jgi:hypothetical protein
MESSGYALVIKGGAQAGWLIELPAMSFELGRGIPPTNGEHRIEIGEPTISRVQAYMYWYPEHDAFMIVHEAQATNPTYVNRSVIKEHVLRPGDTIHMGEMRMLFTLANEAMPSLRATGFGPAVPSTNDLGEYVASGAAEAATEAARRLSEEEPSKFAIRVVRGHPDDLGRIVRVPARVLEDGNPLLFGGPGGRSNDLLLCDPSIVPDLGHFESFAGRLHVVPDSRNQVMLLRGMPLQEACMLHGGEAIAIGVTVLRVEATDKGAAARADGFLEFVQTASDHVPGPFPLVGQATTIGRVRPCDLVVDDPAVSRLHVTIVRRQGAHYLRHQSATNKSMVNGVVVRDEKRLESGDEIRISDRTVLRYTAPTQWDD